MKTPHVHSRSVYQKTLSGGRARLRFHGLWVVYGFFWLMQGAMRCGLDLHRLLFAGWRQLGVGGRLVLCARACGSPFRMAGVQQVRAVA